MEYLLWALVIIALLLAIWHRIRVAIRKDPPTGSVGRSNHKDAPGGLGKCREEHPVEKNRCVCQPEPVEGMLANCPSTADLLGETAAFFLS